MDVWHASHKVFGITPNYRGEIIGHTPRTATELYYYLCLQLSNQLDADAYSRARASSMIDQEVADSYRWSVEFAKKMDAGNGAQGLFDAAIAILGVPIKNK